ncbi:porin, partial [Aquabacterium sp. A08]|uniref:porin n=1 Tax=Aquabacterium sp. A08 TaxID=2718532 RepID=UPI0014214E07
VSSGLLTTSRLGFRGTEDLGGGLKAIFQIETTLKADAPEATTLGDRTAIVGLSGGFGTVKLGRTDTSFDDIR